jgi:hypothetical protein
MLMHYAVKPLISFLSFVMVSNFLVAQDQGLDTLALKAELSSMKNDSLINELRSMLDSAGRNQSFFSINLSASNRLFSTKNNAFNSQQSNAGVMAILPSVSYIHKSGLGFSATGYARSIDAKPSLYQMALSPSYDHIGDKAMYGISYTYYNKNEQLTTAVTPYDHEIYAYVQLKKSWLRPALALGWAEGQYQDVSIIPLRLNGNYFWIRDTSNMMLNDFSLSASVSHSFSFSELLGKNDMLLIVPQLSLIGGLQSYSTVSRSVVLGTRNRAIELDRIRKLYNVSSTEISNFTLQTAAFSTNISWYKKAFSVSAGYFFAYYFDSGMANRTAHIFNLSTGLTF